MKNQLKILAAAPLVGAALIGPNTFAANPYNIEYSGGQPLGADNVQINPTLINDLSPLLSRINNKSDLSDASKWESGYMMDSGTCRGIRFLTISSSNDISVNDNIGYTIAKDQYSANVKINKVILENVDTSDGAISIGIVPGYSYIYAGFPIYEDSACTTRRDGYKRLDVKDNNKVFVEANITLNKNNDKLITNGLYFGIVDIDAAQSFKILNSGNEFATSNMYAKSAEDLQSTDPSVTFKNMFTSNGNYIYSEYDVNSGEVLGTDNTSNIYVSLTNETQQSGLDIVYGFASQAASAIEYYAKQYTIQYESDDNGTIGGISDESVIAGDTVSGSESTPSPDYEFTNWIADVPVTLTDGTTIPAGDPISSEQLKLVVANQDITFTAIHRSGKDEQGTTTVAAPDTGAATGDHQGVIAASLATAIVATSTATYVLRYFAKRHSGKVRFGK